MKKNSIIILITSICILIVTVVCFVCIKSSLNKPRFGTMQLEIDGMITKTVDNSCFYIEIINTDNDICKNGECFKINYDINEPSFKTNDVVHITFLTDSVDLQSKTIDAQDINIKT